MKKILILCTLLTFGMTNAQVFTGKGDMKFQVGANVQNNATGIQVSADRGIGENMSVGLVATYLLSYSELKVNGIGIGKPDFVDRADIRARFSANIANVMGLEDEFDIYPGLSLGLRNFGGHIGTRYFFTDGFGVFGEAGFPIASYDNNLTKYEKLNNQFTFTLGVSFNLN